MEKAQEVSHEGNKIILRSKYSNKADRCTLDRRGAIKDKARDIYRDTEKDYE